MFAQVVIVLVACALGWAYKAIIRPPPPKICGSPGGPPITSPRIQLRDGRYLSYREAGLPKEKAKHKIIVSHGFADSKDFELPVSQELVDELEIYILYFDRAGYGESDPNPKRTVKSDAFDIQELADQLSLGSKFYLVGVSMGAYPAYGCLYYLPHRLAGVSLVSPAVNYWWPSIPTKLSKAALQERLPQDQRLFWIAHHTPFLVHAWMTQKWFPTLSAMEGHPDVFNSEDKEILKKRFEYQQSIGFQDKARQQGDFESLHRDLIVGFGNWEFDPVNIINPFSSDEGIVNMWQGADDRMVPAKLQRYITQKLPWVHYYELPEAGHFFINVQEHSNAVLRAQIIGKEA